MPRKMWRLLLATLACAASAEENRPRRITPLSIVEGTLGFGRSVTRGVGDTLAVGVGSTLRFVGDGVRDVGNGLEGLGSTVTGNDATGAGADGAEPIDATRRLLGKPLHLLGATVRTAADAVSMLGDATERVAAGTLGLVPDAVEVVESSVRSLRALGSDDDFRQPAASESNAASDGGAARAAAVEAAAPAAAAAPRLNASEVAAAAAAASKTQAAVRGPLLARAARGLLEWRDGGGEPNQAPHALLALGAVAAVAPRVGRGGLLLVLLLGALFLKAVEEAQRGLIRERAGAAALREIALSADALVTAEPVHWLNALLASGWRETVGQKVAAELRESFRASLAELGDQDLPKTLQSVELVSLKLGPTPPRFTGAAAAAKPFVAAGGRAAAAAGCAMHFGVDWCDDDASATLAFTLASGLASRPHLIVRRLRLRGPMRVEWEWDRHSSAAAPYVGRIRFCFTREPEFDSSFEPLGAVDLTQLPAIGAFVRDSLRAQLIASAVWPNWVETDWREYLVPPKTPAPPAALYYK